MARRLPRTVIKDLVFYYKHDKENNRAVEMYKLKFVHITGNPKETLRGRIAIEDDLQKMKVTFADRPNQHYLMYVEEAVERAESLSKVFSDSELDVIQSIAKASLNAIDNFVLW